MEKKQIDWSSIGFGYIPTEKRYVSNYSNIYLNYNFCFPYFKSYGLHIAIILLLFFKFKSALCFF